MRSGVPGAERPFSWSTLPRPILALAPMEDVTDTVYRGLIREWSGRASFGLSSGPHVMFTEFTRADAAANGNARTGRLRFLEGERPLIAQLWGTRPEEFRRAAARLADDGFDGLDINMGCPAKKIRKHGACSALIATPSIAAEIIAACREGAPDLPLSVKTRIGITDRRTEEWCGRLLEQRLDCLTVHPRLAVHNSEGWADWREIARIARLRDSVSPQTVVLGNGDVRDVDHARRLAAHTRCDGVMIGRGIFADPFLFVRGALPGGARPRAPRVAEAASAPGGAHSPAGIALAFDSWRSTPAEVRLTLLREHITAFRSAWGDRRNYEILKKFFRNYVHGPGSELARLLEALYSTHETDEALKLIADALGRRGHRTPGHG